MFGACVRVCVSHGILVRSDLLISVHARGSFVCFHRNRRTRVVRSVPIHHNPCFVSGTTLASLPDLVDLSIRRIRDTFYIYPSLIINRFAWLRDCGKTFRCYRHHQQPTHPRRDAVGINRSSAQQHMDGRGVSAAMAWKHLQGLALWVGDCHATLCCGWVGISLQSTHEQKASCTDMRISSAS